MGISAEQLRIGNWISIEGRELQTTSRNIYHIDKSGLRAEPIELTEQWLKDFGFKPRRYDEFIYKLNDITSLILIGTNFQSLLVQAKDDKIYLDKIKYVHSLQNLYHSLTGNELKSLTLIE